MRERLERNVPALLVAAVCVGIATANVVSIPIPAAVALACAGGIAAARIGGLARLACVAVALAVLGLAWGGVRLSALAESRLDDALGRPQPARLVVTSSPRRTSFSVRVFATVTRFGGDELRERVLLHLPPERAPPRGAIVETRRAWPVEPRGPETGFDERRWLARRGVHVVIRARELRVVGRRGGIGGVTDRLRAHVERTIAQGAGGERRSLLAGVVLGADEDVEEDLRDAFKDSGLLHLMAVSGQNVAIIAVGVVGLAWLAGIGILWGQAAAMAVVLGYAGAVGWQPSVVRATVAGCLVSLAWIAGRPRDRWHALALGALLLLTWMPAAALEAGFQLSFAAVAAIFVLVPRLERTLEGYPMPPLVRTGAALATACAAVTAPIVLLHFGQMPLWTVPANILAEGAMAPLLGLVLAAAAIEPLSGSAATALVWLAGWCAAWLAWCARVFSGLPFATAGRVAGTAILLGGVILLLAWRQVPRYRRGEVLAAGTALCVCAAAGALWLRGGSGWTPPQGLRVTFLDVGQGDSALLEVPGGAVLVDQGPPEAEVATQLRGMGLRSLSAIVLTHPQRDHIGGAADILRDQRVGAVLDPGLAASSGERDEALDAAAERGVSVVLARAGDEYRVGELRLRVLWPDRAGPASEDPNLRAVVLIASYGSTDVLLPADAESDVTRRFVSRSVEVLKVAHHGSEDTGLEGQLRILRPRVAVISAGRGNDYGHPRTETLRALETVPGIRVFRTDLDGRVVVESDGRRLWARSAR